MKNRPLPLMVVLAQLALLLCVCMFRSDVTGFSLSVGLLAGVIIVFPLVCLRSPLPAAEGKNDARTEGAPDLAEDRPALLSSGQSAVKGRDGSSGQGTEQAVPLRSDESGADKTTHKHTPTVLVADDSEINRAILSEILGQHGLLTVEASDGQEAVDIVREWDISLVLMDLEMPVMDGKEATAQIRGMGKLPQDVPILAMTAHTGDSLRMDCLSLGMNGYLTKPVDLQELYAALQKWLPGGLAGAAGEGGGGAHLAGADGSGRDAPINTDAGLAATGGNKKLYHDLLNRFVERYGRGASLLRELLKKESYVEAARLAHTIKGVAANLGMKRITDITKGIESCLPEVPPGENLLEQFEEVMREVIEYINSLQVDQDTARIGDQRLTDEDAAALRGLLENLPHRVERDWGGTRRALEKYLTISANTPVAGKVAALCRAVDDFDLEAIERSAVDLQQSLVPGR
ncbi:MAG: response regulator [Desulfovibrio sp.]|jgi:CheY-like chemotaxis protein/HPt (histidine-containing phosphotransfer) domain-containing protein|nr:response regulator [Desulfovibrio sp.]